MARAGVTWKDICCSLVQCTRLFSVLTGSSGIVSSPEALAPLRSCVRRSAMAGRVSSGWSSRVLTGIGVKPSPVRTTLVVSCSTHTRSGVTALAEAGGLSTS
jgi:hypothetical protein